MDVNAIVSKFKRFKAPNVKLQCARQRRMQNIQEGTLELKISHLITLWNAAPGRISKRAAPLSGDVLQRSNKLQAVSCRNTELNMQVTAGNAPNSRWHWGTHHLFLYNGNMCIILNGERPHNHECKEPQPQATAAPGCERVTETRCPLHSPTRKCSIIPSAHAWQSLPNTEKGRVCAQ